MTAKRAGLSLAKLLGAHRDTVACYNMSGGLPSTPLEEVLDDIDRSVEAGIGGIKTSLANPIPAPISRGWKRCRPGLPAVRP